MTITRDKFSKLENILGYIFGISFFINFNLSKELITGMIIVTLLRYFLYGERLECGDKKIEKYLLFFLFGGLIWNFFAGMSFIPVRQYLKIMRWVILPFYFYPLMSRDKKYINKFSYGLFLGGVILFLKSAYEFYKAPWTRVYGFEGIDTTGFGGMVIGIIGFALLLNKKEYIKKILGLALMGIGMGLIVFTQMRSAMIGILIGYLIVLLFSINYKKLLVLLGIMGILMGISLKNIEHSSLKRFTTAFDTEKTLGNSSNYMRILLWKNAIWRIKEHPIMGSGTNNDKKLFLEYCYNMKEETPTEKYMKDAMIFREFSDSHNMYLNAISDNGIFSLVQFFLWFGICPYLFIKNRKSFNENIRILNLMVGGILASYYFSGLTWSVWRNKWTPMIFWMSLVVLIYCYGIEKKENNQ
ncbi:O-antigen ligase family protein [Cetobacterium sp. SF1]|uniref:O-antigen ligase family protein n=1 Tax=Cetobacterium sp. SF1 TaxID=3417654 RepID=UPI003CEA8C1C